MARKDAIYELLKPQVTTLGYELYDVDFEKAGKKRILTVYIDRKEGISLEDCEKVSREISAFLDAADPIAETYTLQMSSTLSNCCSQISLPVGREIGRASCRERV